MLKIKNLLLGLGAASAVIIIPQTSQAAMIDLAANLDQSAEVYPPGLSPNLVPGATGSAQMTYNTETNLFNWTINFSNLSGPLTRAHFHAPAPPGVAAPIIIDIGTLPPPMDLLSSPIIGSIGITEIQEQQLLSGLWYINLHTNSNPTGEIRGQIAVVPEPSSLGLIIMTGVSFIVYQLQQKIPR